MRPSVCLCGREGAERECVRERRDDSHEYKCFYTTKWFNIVFFVPHQDGIGLQSMASLLLLINSRICRLSDEL